MTGTPGIVGIPAQPLAHLEAALLRQSHVEHDEVGTIGQRALHGRIAVRRGEHAEAVGGEGDLQQLEDAPVVVHEQDARCRRRLARGRRPRSSRPPGERGRGGPGPARAPGDRRACAACARCRRARAAARSSASRTSARKGVRAPWRATSPARKAVPASSGSSMSTQASDQAPRSSSARSAAAVSTVLTSKPSRASSRARKMRAVMESSATRALRIGRRPGDAARGAGGAWPRGWARGRRGGGARRHGRPAGAADSSASMRSTSSAVSSGAGARGARGAGGCRRRRARRRDQSECVFARRGRLRFQRGRGLGSGALGRGAARLRLGLPARPTARASRATGRPPSAGASPGSASQ